eukprot:Skav231890  [mRNA]  locus=scaffold708:262658:264354:- [translate_table: standard]
MWVSSVENVLRMTGTFQPHQVLKAQGLLAEWKDDMFTIFVSHKWLGHQHPDPGADQLHVLQGFLRNLIARKISIQNDAVSQFYGRVRTLAESEHDSFKDAYIWLDYFCVPQLEGHPEEELQALKDLQLQYIYSIPYYVDVSQVFLALVPKVIHYDTLKGSDYYTWLDSGWCRTEFWCKLLSTRSSIPIIVVKSQDVAHFTQFLWFHYPVHSGTFSVERDRASCSQVIQTALAKHLSVLRQAKNKTTYRLYLALFEEMTGLERKCRTLESFVSEFGFSWPLRNKGLGPAACAALSGDHELLRSLAGAKASLHTHAPGVPTMVLSRLLELPADVNGGQGGYGSLSPLHNIAFSGGSSNDLRSAQLLLASRADINQVFQPKGPARAMELLARCYCRCRKVEPPAVANFFANLSTTPLGWCAIYDNEQLLIFLLRARADPEIRNNRGLRPIDFAGSDNIKRILQCPTEEIYLLEYESEQISECL